MYKMPESPLYYIIKNDEATAKEVLKKLRGENSDVQEQIDDFKVCPPKRINKLFFSLFWSLFFLRATPRLMNDIQFRR